MLRRENAVLFTAQEVGLNVARPRHYSLNELLAVSLIISAVEDTHSLRTSIAAFTIAKMHDCSCVNAAKSVR